MRFFVCLTFLVLLNLPSCAQNSYKKEVAGLTNKLYQHLYINKDSSYFYLNKISQLAKQNNDFGEHAGALISMNRIAGYYFDLDTIKKCLALLDIKFKESKKILDTISNAQYYKNSLFYDKGMYYYQLDNYQQSHTFFEKIINSIEKDPKFELNTLDTGEKDLLKIAYVFKAKMYSDVGKYRLAKQYYKKSIRFLKGIKPKGKREVKNKEESLDYCYGLLAEVYKREKDYARSNTYFIRSLNYKLVNSTINSIIATAEHIAENYITLEKADSVSHYLNIIKKHVTEGHAFQSRYHSIKSKFYAKNKQYPLAQNEATTALALFKSKWQNRKHLQVAQAHHKLGLLYFESGQPELAIPQYDLALEQLTGTNSVNTSINKIEELKILKDKAIVLNAHDKEKGNTMATVEKALTILDSLKPQFKNSSDKLFLIEDAYALFETGLEASYDSYLQTDDASFIDKAFFFSEKSKSALLFEALLNSKATVFSDVPENLLEEEQLLKSKITHLEKIITQSKQKNEALEEQLFEHTNAHLKLINKIENDHKSFYDLKYNTQVASLHSLQKALKKDDLLISYFYGTKALYIITITNSSKKLIKYEIHPGFETSVRKVYTLLSDPKSDVSALRSESYDLFSKIIAPGLENTSKKNLIILADGLLNYIPFGSLAIHKKERKYLIEEYAISYANSATLLLQLQEKRKNNNNVLAFAPVFKNDATNGLLSLPNNKAEVQNILTHFRGKPYIDDQATLNNFKDESPDYSVIHFATHAIFNDEFPEYSYLAFTPTPDNEHLLYVSNLYNLKLNSDLVTLSACESGIGNLKRGEGLMSLARGFYFSGASSISSTLWKINDASSASLMNDFYAQLSKGSSKQHALQEAKRIFIENNKDNALVHPYFWSGFIISGNTNPLTSNSSWLWFLFGALLLILLVVIYRKRRKVNPVS